MRSQRIWIALESALLAAIASSLQASDFAVDPQKSKLEVAVSATVDSFTATLNHFETSIQVDKTSGRPTGGTFSWDFKDLNTGSTKREKEMLHWLDHEHRPDAVFSFAGLSETNGATLLRGDLKMHGVTNQIAFPLAIHHQGTNLTWTGDLNLDHRPYDLPKIVKFGLLRVNPVLHVHFTLSGTVKD